MTKTIPTLGAAAAALALVAAGCGNSTSGATQPSTTASPATAVKANLSEFKIATSTSDVQAGKVTFTAVNDGKTAHELVVIKTDKAAGDLGKGSRVSESGSVGEVSDVAPGQTKSNTIDLKPGHYALICNIPGHYMSGMHADLTAS
jgi:uncharacterized cupredoxin-like copper-binding protein